MASSAINDDLTCTESASNGVGRLPFMRAPLTTKEEIRHDAPNPVITPLDKNLSCTYAVLFTAPVENNSRQLIHNLLVATLTLCLQILRSCFIYIPEITCIYTKGRPVVSVRVPSIITSVVISFLLRNLVSGVFFLFTCFRF